MYLRLREDEPQDEEALELIVEGHPADAHTLFQVL